MSASEYFADADDIETLLQQLTGAGSSCWDNLGGAGVFDSEQAKKFCDDAYLRLQELGGVPEYHDDMTMFKIQEIIHSYGHTEEKARMMIQELQNAGILFRERRRES